MLKSGVSNNPQSMMEGFVTWIGGGVASAFFASLERSSCVGLAVADDDLEEEGEELITGHWQSDKPEPADAWGVEIRDWSLIEPEKSYRKNPLSDLFAVGKFHHIEFWCGDASNTWRRFAWGLGMNLVAKSDQTTGNQTFCSYVLRSNDLVYSFTAPYSKRIDQSGSKIPLPGYKADVANSFFRRHGLAVRAVGILVQDAEKAFKVAVENGAEEILVPTVLVPENSSGSTKIAEVKLSGDVVLRFVSNHGFLGPYLPNYQPVVSVPISYGLQRLDHVVCNVPNLIEAAKYVCKFSGFHKYAEFSTCDVGTAESGVNGLVLANNNEMVLLLLNEPVLGTKRKSQIQTYLENNEGPGLQHLAVMCDDIFFTVKEMRMRSTLGGFDFFPKPASSYYQNLSKRVTGILTAKQCRDCEELGILVGEDGLGVLLRIFTKPLGDRPTIFLQITQRVQSVQRNADGRIIPRKQCAGFNTNYFSELFRTIEGYEKTINKS